MKRLLPLIVVAAFLAVTPAAFAQWNWRTTVQVGSAYSSRSVTGSCSTARVGTTAVLRCRTATGQAAVRYVFKVPVTCMPTATAHVDAVGNKKVSVATTTGQVRVTVKTVGQGTVTIATAGIGYYCS
jgi:hypothetical protein